MPIATKSSNFDISKKKNLEKIIHQLLNQIQVGDTLLLYGDLGVGKTTSARLIINKLQKKKKVKISEVPSPTFNIVNEYQISDTLICHYDLFRLNKKRECENIGINENIDNKILIIEWPEKINKQPKNRLELYFKYKNNFTSRSLSTESFGRCKKYEILEKK